MKNAGEVLAVVDEVLTALTPRAPVFDENNVFVLPCRICGKGFLQGIVGQNGQNLQLMGTLSQNRVQIREYSLDVLQCDACCNVQYFAPGQPYTALWGNRKSRVNPQPSKDSSLRW